MVKEKKQATVNPLCTIVMSFQSSSQAQLLRLVLLVHIDNHRVNIFLNKNKEPDLRKTCSISHKHYAFVLSLLSISLCPELFSSWNDQQFSIITGVIITINIIIILLFIMGTSLSTNQHCGHLWRCVQWTLHMLPLQGGATHNKEYLFINPCAFSHHHRY